MEKIDYAICFRSKQKQTVELNDNASVKFCSNCGNEILTNAKFCGNCGTQIQQ